MEDLTISFADVKYGYMNCILKPCLVCIGIVSESDVVSSRSCLALSRSSRLSALHIVSFVSSLSLLYLVTLVGFIINEMHLLLLTLLVL